MQVITTGSPWYDLIFRWAEEFYLFLAMLGCCISAIVFCGGGGEGDRGLDPAGTTLISFSLKNTTSQNQLTNCGDAVNNYVSEVK